LQNPEFLQFNRNALQIVFNNDKTILKVDSEYNALEKLTNEIAALFKTDTGSDITDELVTLDIRRDDAITGIGFYLEALSRYNDATIKANANLLLQEIKLYGTGIARLSYQNETATITSIVDKFNNDTALKAAVTATPLLADWVAELKTANNLFDTKYVARAVEQGAASPDTIRAKRLEAMQAYYDLRDMINGYATTTKGAVPYPATINSINALIDDYNTTINQRAALAAAARAKESNSTPTDNTPK
jgi:hypothetical protein